MEEGKKPSVAGIVKALTGTFGTGLVVFFAAQLWISHEKSKDEILELNRRIRDLEEDKSKWGTLTELHNKTVAMELEMARQKGIMEGFVLAVQGGMVDKPVPSQKPVLPVPAPKPESNLKDPKDLFKNVEEFQKLQQQKYPLQQKK
jgi:hypothetical protein